MKNQVRRVTREKINSLKYLILKSNDAGRETKKACFALIDASEGLTKSVYFTGYSEDISCGVHNLISSGYDTHLSILMNLIGTKLDFSHHFGYFSRGIFIRSLRPGRKYTSTIWLSPKFYDTEAVKVTEKQVKKVKLVNPFLAP